MSFSWDVKQLRKDLEYDNVSYRRAILLTMLTLFVVAVFVGAGFFETFTGMFFAIILIGGTSAFSLIVFIYSLIFNKKDYDNAMKSENVVTVHDDVVKVGKEQFSFLNVIKMIDTDFKGVNAFNSSVLVENGQYVGFFVDKSVGLKKHEGSVKVVKFNNFDLVYLPLRYVKDSDVLLEALKGKASDYNIEWDHYSDSLSLGRANMELSNKFNNKNNNKKNKMLVV